MKYELVIWDFNGTVLDDTGISMDAMNEVLRRRSMKLIESKEDFQNIFCFPVEKYYEKLGFDFKKEPFKTPADEWVELYTEKKFSAPTVSGIKETLSALRSAGAAQIILSACEESRLREHISICGLDGYFDEIIGCTDVYAAGKSDIAEKWKEKSSVDPQKVLFVGDSDHDLQCARIIGCDCVLYSGGFMSEKRLKALGVPVIKSIGEVVFIVLNN